MKKVVKLALIIGIAVIALFGGTAVLDTGDTDIRNEFVPGVAAEEPNGCPGMPYPCSSSGSGSD